MVLDPNPSKRPERVSLEGRLVSIVPLDPGAHGSALWESVGDPQHDGLWAYLFDGPYRERATFDASLRKKAGSTDPLFFAIVDRRSGLAIGHASYLRIEPAHRVIEVGSILYTPALQRTAGATEAMYLMARHAFEDLGYRRYEWKCDSRNELSRRAALRLGFTFEGVFRQHMIVKGRNRDTAWFSMLDSEWPDRKSRFERWLAPSNFDEQGMQRTQLSLAESDVTRSRSSSV
jgi:RimJ/RimL family protein N-acetyltransferase